MDSKKKKKKQSQLSPNQSTHVTSLRPLDLNTPELLSDFQSTLSSIRTLPLDKSPPVLRLQQALIVRLVLRVLLVVSYRTSRVL